MSRTRDASPKKRGQAFLPNDVGGGEKERR